MLDERGPVARAGYRSPHRPDAARLATGELGYHGQEGYRTRHYDAARLVPLPTHERPNGSVFDGERQHPEYDPAYPAGYETASTGFIMVGAREYDPEIGRFLQPDPRPTGPELQWGQLNRWAYCANDPVNASDPSGETPIAVILVIIAVISLASLAYDVYTEGFTSKNVFDLVLALLPGALGLAGRVLGRCGGRIVWEYVRWESSVRGGLYADERRQIQEAVDFIRWIYGF